MTAVSFDDVTIQPVVADPAYGRGYRFGAFDTRGAAIPAFDHPWIEHQQDLGAAQALDGTYIYGGVLMNHFGHVLLEGLSRLWFIRTRPELPVLWHSLDLPVPHTAWQGWLDQLWSVLGLIRHRHVIMRETVRVERVLVPAHGVRADGYIDPVQAEALAVVGEGSSYAGRRVWLSRAGLPRRFGRLIGEGEVQAALEARGWVVVQPERLPVVAQAAVFNDAAAVAGFAGSAFHAVLLAKHPKARLCIVRRPSVTDGYYDAAARARGLDQRYVDPPLAPLATVNAWSTFSITDPAALAGAVQAGLADV